MLLGEIDIGGAGFLGTLSSLDQGFAKFSSGVIGKSGEMATAAQGAHEHLSKVAVSATEAGQAAGGLAKASTALGTVAKFGAAAAGVLSGIAKTINVLSPAVELIPDKLGKWVPHLKTALAGSSAVNHAWEAATGELGVMGAGLLYMEQRTLGLSKKWAALNSVLAYGGSKVVGAARGLGSLIFGGKKGDAGAAEKGGDAVGSIAKKASETKDLGAAAKGIMDFSGALRQLAPAMMALGTLAGVLTGLKGVMDLGGDLNDLSTRTGETVGSLVILRSAFEQTGVGADNTEQFILKLQDSIAGLNEDGKSTAGALKALGVSAGELRDLPAIGQIQKLQEGFAKLDQTTKVQVARDLFGKSGGKTLSLLGDTGVMDDARKAAGPLADIMEKSAGSFDKLGDIVGSLKLNFQEFFAGALSKVAPEASNIAEALGSIDFVGIGETVGALASIFLVLANVIASLAPIINGVSETMSEAFGSGSKADAGLASKYRGFAKIHRAGEKDLSDNGGTLSALQKIGGGGGFGSGDPALSESRLQTRLLQQLVDMNKRSQYSVAGGMVPV